LSERILVIIYDAPGSITCFGVDFSGTISFPFQSRIRNIGLGFIY
jgi:hypothetical protein